MLENNTVGMHLNTSVSKKVPVVLLILIVIALRLAAEPGGETESTVPFNPFLEEEAPRSLIQIGPDDDAVDLYLLGRWAAGTRFAYGMAFHPARDDGTRVTAPYPYPGFTGEIFYQTVDLTLSLWLYQKFFFEATFLDDSLFNSVLAGYHGDEDEPVQEVLIGKGPFQISSYPYLGIGSDGGMTSNTVPGISARLKTAATEHEFLVQLDGSFPVTRRYQGTASLEETRVPGNTFVNAVHFILPDGGIDSMVVLVQDADGEYFEAGGTGRYRELNDSEMVFDYADGEIILLEPATARVLVWYRTGDGDEVGATGAGSGTIVPRDPRDLSPVAGPFGDFSFTDAAYSQYRETLTDGRDYLVLYDPALLCLFEGAGFYDVRNLNLHSVDDATITIVSAGTRRRFEGGPFSMELRGGDRFLHVYAADSTPRSTGYRFPFADIDAVAAAMYGTRKQLNRSVDLLIERAFDAGRYQIESDAVPGSVTVFLNGTALSGVTVDYRTGAIDLPAAVAATDRVEITYRRNDPTRTETQISAAVGNRWTPAENTSVFLAAALRWNAWQSAYSSRLDENPGTIAASTGFSWKLPESGNLQVSAAATLQYRTSDSSGFLRILSMEGDEQYLSLSPANLFPAAPPSGMSQDSRVPSIYRDYRRTDIFGNSSLLSYDDPTSDDAQYVKANRTGPYLAGPGNSGITGSVGVLEWDSWDYAGGHTWSGAQLQVPGGSLDLQTLESVRLSIRYENDAADAVIPDAVEIYLVLGSSSEDLDGDRTIDEGESTLQPELPFTDSSGEDVLAGGRYPTGTTPYTEDANGNGILDDEEDASVLTVRLDSEIFDFRNRPDEWIEVEIPIDDNLKLAASRSARLILTSTGDDIPPGRLLFSRLELESGTLFTTVTGASGSSSARYTDDPLTGSDSLMNVRQTVADRFHRNAADDQKVARVSWTGVDTLSTDSAVIVRTVTDAFSTDAYDTLRLYVLTGSSGALPEITEPDATVRIRYANGTDSLADEITASFDLADLTTSPGAGSWQEIVLDLSEKTVSLDGRNLAADVSVPAGVRDLHIFSIEIRGSAEGVVYLDELHAADPVDSLATAGHLLVDWSPAVEIAGPGQTPLLHQVRISEYIALRSSGYRDTGSEITGYDSGTGSAGTAVTATTLGFSIFNASISTEARFSNGDSVRSEARHSAYLPFFENHLAVTDKYSRSWMYVEDFESRDLGVVWSSERTFAGSLTGTVRQDRDKEVRNWSLAVSTPSAIPTTASLKFLVQYDGSVSELSADGYPESWLAGTQALFGGEPMESVTRLSSVTPQMRIPFENAGRSGYIAIETDAVAHNHRSTVGTQTSSLGLSLSGERKNSGGTPWTISPSAGRTYAFTAPTGSKSLYDDASEFLDGFGRYPVPFRQIPLYDLFAPEIALPAGISAQTYESAAAIAFSRPVRSRIRDLIVPAEANFTVDRTVQGELDSVRDRREWDARVSAIGINVWGTQSARPVFQWYESEEIRNTLSCTISEELGFGEPPSWAVGLETGALLFLDDDARITIDQAIDFSRNETSVLTFASGIAFTRRVDSYPPVRILDRLDESPYRNDREALAVELAADDGAFESWKAEISHETTFVLGKNGSIRAWGEIGWITRPFADSGYEHLVGLLFGLEGTLAF